MAHDACGRSYSSQVCSSALEHARGFRVARPTEVISEAVELLCDGKIVGWFEGRSELGPRALGQRSIFCDPRWPDGKEVLNSRVKRRESFRPFAPAILLDEVEDWFEMDGTIPKSPFMLRVCKFKPEKIAEVPAVSHIDGTGRLQTVTRETNGKFYELIEKFYEKIGVPIILNTSFDIMGEPIVEIPADALACLSHSGLDCCVFEDMIVFKEEQS